MFATLLLLNLTPNLNLNLNRFAAAVLPPFFRSSVGGHGMSRFTARYRRMSFVDVCGLPSSEKQIKFAHAEHSDKTKSIKIKIMIMIMKHD